jgi:hypothetical protein
MRHTSGSYINSEKCNYYMGKLRARLQEFIQPAAGCVISLADKPAYADLL